MENNLTKKKSFRCKSDGIISPRGLLFLLLIGLFSFQVQAQTSQISGVVVDELKQPVVGATVIIKGSSNGTVTDLDGRFKLSSAAQKATLNFSYIGYQKTTVEAIAGVVVEVQLEVDNKTLEEVVVVGYGTSRKKDLTGASARINVDDKATLPNINAVQSMRGVVSGLTVTDNGKAGSDATILIRGNRSMIAGNDPLIVLDGVPMVGGKMSDISNSDIESIDVLKDASSAAIYGSRASNGVILITTKKGTNSKPLFNYSGYYGKSDFARTPKMMGPEKYLQLKTDAAAFSNTPVPLTSVEQAAKDAGEISNPWDAVSQDAPMMNHELSISGKTDRVNYYLSGSYADQKSVILGDQFKRLTVRGNFDIKVTNWLNIGTNTGYSFKDYSGASADLGMAFMMSPYAKYRYDDGAPTQSPMGDPMVSNPLFDALWKTNTDISNNLFSNLYADIKLPLKGLTYRMNIGNNIRYSEVKNHTPAYDRDGAKRTSFASQNWSKNYDFTFENILKYNTTFAKIHNIDGTLMYGIERTINTGLYGQGNQLFSDALGYYGTGLGFVQNASSYGTEMKAISAMARVGYRLLDRYMLNLTVRRDGFSAFGAGNKFGYFPSLGLGWVISDEKFMAGIKNIDFLKLRYSYGKNGNRAIKPYSSLSIMNSNDFKYVFGDGGASSVGVSPSQMENPVLSWESTLASNVGIDFSFFGQRISGSVEYYNMNTKDLLLNTQIPKMNGYPTFNTNVGSVNNKGIEITLNTVNIKSGHFEWSTNITFAKNVNKITELMDINGDGVSDNDPANGRFIGKSMFSAYDYVWDGIWQVGDDFALDPAAKPGYVKFKDVSGPNGVPDGAITPLDRTVQESSLPNFTAGLTNTFSFKGVSLSVLLFTSQGGKSSNWYTSPGSNFYSRVNQIDLPYWTPENPSTTRPSVGYSNPKSWGFYEDKSYIRLQDVSLAYDFPKSILSKIKLTDLKIFVSGKNLATWTKWNGWDPEHGAGLDPFSLSTENDYSRQSGPLMKSVVIGLNLKF